ncbi:MAG: hypothetical protein RIR72_831, partial [Actinomycetota bacterium]
MTIPANIDLLGGYLEKQEVK